MGGKRGGRRWTFPLAGGVDGEVWCGDRALRFRWDPRQGRLALDGWTHEKDAWSLEQSKGSGHMHPRQMLRELERAMPDGAMVSTDIGNICSVSNSYLRFERPRSMFAAMSFGNCGYAFPTIIGAKVAAPDRPAIAYVGDGAWGMSFGELQTCVRENIPVTAVVFNNGQWGAEKKNHVDFYANRFVGVNLDVSTLGIGNCRLDVVVPTATIDGYYDLAPAGDDANNVDVNLLGGTAGSTSRQPVVNIPTVQHEFTSGACDPDTPIIGGIISSIAGSSVPDAIRSSFVNELRDPDGTGPADSPIADAVEDALSGISISGAVGSAVDAHLDTPLEDIIEDGTGITFRSDADFGTIDPSTGLATCPPVTGAPDIHETATIPSMFPALGSTTHYQHDPDGRLLAESTAAGVPDREYIWLPLDGQPWALPIALVTDAGTASPRLHYLHADQLGMPVAMTSAGLGQVEWSATYRPFGETDAITGTESLSLRFPGQFFDPETGFHQNGFRDYDPRLGRYLQSDPIGLDGGLNAYAYVGGDPINLIDPAGETTLVPALPALSGAGAAAAMCAANPVLCGALGAATLCAITPGCQEAVWSACETTANAIASLMAKGDKGLPESELGPSGKPKIHKPRFPTKKAAKEAAAQAGAGEPVHHPTPSNGRPHYHATDSKGRKIPGTHYEY